MTSENPSRTGVPAKLKGWLAILAIYAAAGAVLGGPGRGPVSSEDADWQKWAGIVLYWAVMGAVIGATVQWLRPQYPSYRRAVMSFAVVLPLFMVFVEALRVLAAWYSGGWQAGVASVAIGALVGVVVCPVTILLFLLTGKLLGKVFPPPPAGTDKAAHPPL